MRHAFFIILPFLAAPAFFSAASAWQWETHSTLAEKACRDFDCGCIEEIRDAAVVPDRDFRDNIRHHCYNLSVPCVSSEYYDCPKKNDCPALEYAQNWLSDSHSKTGCEKWKSIGIASHYFFDSKVFWHKTQGEDYYKCHEPFEGKVGKKFENRDGSAWVIEACGAKEDYSNMVQYVADFEAMLAEKEGFKRTGDVPLLPECGWLCRIFRFVLSLF